MDNKLITVTSPLLPDLDEFHELLKQIWDSKWITNNGHFISNWRQNSVGSHLYSSKKVSRRQ